MISILVARISIYYRNTTAEVIDCINCWITFTVTSHMIVFLVSRVHNSRCIILIRGWTISKLVPDHVDPDEYGHQDQQIQEQDNGPGNCAVWTFVTIRISSFKFTILISTSLTGTTVGSGFTIVKLVTGMSQFFESLIT
jgi:hypothetical protein